MRMSMAAESRRRTAGHPRKHPHRLEEVVDVESDDGISSDDQKVLADESLDLDVGQVVEEKLAQLPERCRRPCAQV